MLAELGGAMAAMGGLGDMFSGLMGPIFGMASAAGTNRTMREIARQNRKWMEKMSNTAHQREVDDLRAAGLNPILSAANLSGASTPSVSTDYSQQSYTPDFSGLGKGFGRMANIASAYVDYKNKVANTDLQEEQAKQSASATQLNIQKTIGQTYQNALDKAQSLFAVEKAVIGKNHALENYRKAVADADASRAKANDAMADSIFRNSATGRELYYRNKAVGHFKNSWIHDLFSIGHVVPGMFYR